MCYHEEHILASPAVAGVSDKDHLYSLLLLLLRSPAIALGFTILGEIFACVTIFNPTIKVVTFRLRGWCVLGVFLLPAFTRLGHERQDLLSPCDEMHVCTD